MGNLIVLAFKDETGAENCLGEVGKLQQQELIKVSDACVVTRGQDGKVQMKQAANLVGAGALGGAFWGMLIGLLFWVPIFGMAVGAALGAMAGKGSDYGINDDFIKDVGQQIQPGNSALFLLVESAQADKVIADLKQFNGKVIRTSLSNEQEKQLKDAFNAA
jgi:uncharacterized membrane protein